MLAVKLLTLFPVLALGQYGAPASTTSPAASSTAGTAPAPGASSSAMHIVAVGRDGLAFTPNNITAAVGDQVIFEFYPATPPHSVSQSTFAAPCFHLTDAAGVATGIDSGFVTVPSGATALSTYISTVQVTTPLWFFCAQSGHCAGGMVFAVNPPTTGNTMAAFISNAKSPGATPSVTNTIVEGAPRTAGVGVAASIGPTTTPGSSTSASAQATATKSAASGSIQIGVAVWLGAFVLASATVF